ncbi:translation elongation factor Ts [Candidatus Peribacteria bacterium]|nr:translation elongation factor Ts [Candidatus Peribacteria bacterium]
MTTVNASLVASVRARTGVSMMECKKALDEAQGDEEKAIEILRKKGAAAAAKKADREQSEGAVFSATGNGKAAIVTLNCETDFVARDDTFQSVGNELATTLMTGGMDAAKAKAEEKIPALVQKLGENITLGEMSLSEAAVSGVYVHSNGKIGVVIGLSGGSEDLARDIAMHAAAMNPSYVSPDDVTPESVDKEKEIWREQLAQEGKPAEIMEKIMVGKEKKFREENALLTQEFVKDPSKLIQDLLDGSRIEEYVRVSI